MRRATRHGTAGSRLAPAATAASAPESCSLSPAHTNGHANGSAATTGTNGTHEPHRGAARVEFEDVTFTYPGASRPAVSDLSLTIPAGAMVGVTGAVGSGKSGLAKALVGVYQLQEGRILLDGRPLTSFQAAERAATIGYLPQDPWLFSGTVRDNVVFGASELDGPTADALVARAIKLAALERDIAGFPDGLDTPHRRGRRQGIRRAASADLAGQGAAGGGALPAGACWCWTIRSRRWTWTPRSGWLRG